MKRIFSSLFAIIVLVGTTGIFTACQEDAPEIDFTMNVTVNNDFTEVVNAINNGTMKQEAAIAALTAAIEKMQGDQNAKLDAIVEAINTLATTLDAKLAIIEAAMKAQTLALETKLGLIEAAIKALPDYTDRLKAIEAAIKGMPDYSDKLAAIETAIAALPNYSEQLGAIAAAIEALPNYTEQMGALETALEAIAENIKDQQNQYADELAALTDAIDAIKSEVAAGNKSREDALAEIIALLESGALAGGGSGSGDGSGSGGSEDASPFVKLEVYSDYKRSEDDDFYCVTLSIPDAENLKFEGAEVAEKYAYLDPDLYWLKLYTQHVTTIKVRGNFTDFYWNNTGTLKSIDISNYPGLQWLDISYAGHDYAFESITISKDKNTELTNLGCWGCNLNDEEMTALVESLPDRTGKEQGTFEAKYHWPTPEDNVLSSANVNKAKAKNWKVVDSEGDELEGDF